MKRKRITTMNNSALAVHQSKTVFLSSTAAVVLLLPVLAMVSFDIVMIY